jgi:bile acid-coenzyme A ligase
MAEVLLGDIPERGVARRGAGHWAVRHGEGVLSWGELAERSLRRANALAAHGVGEGDRVVLAMPNANAFFELTFAIWKLGATPTVVSHRLPRAELEAILALAGAKAVIASDPALCEATGALPGDFGRDHPDNSPRESRLAPHWKIMTSGGSTGRPKLIVDALPSLVDDSVTSAGLPRDGVMLNPGPLYHNFPFCMTHVALLHGTSVVGMERFDAGAFLDLVERFGVQWVSLVPTMMNRIARLPAGQREGRDMSSLERVWHTAAPMPPWLKQFWIDWLGPERIWEMYGGSEGIGITQLNGSEWLAHRGSVGKPLGGELLIRGEDSQALPPGEVGEIYMRRIGADPASPAYEYVGAESRRLPDGFESLGDFGWVDEDGYLYIADRRTDMIVSGGRNIYPAEVEAALLEHPAVAEAIAIGLPDADLGARVHAIVRPEAGAAPSGKELLAFASKRLIAYKLPRDIEFTASTLRDEAGKARRSRLREERIAAMRERENGTDG